MCWHVAVVLLEKGASENLLLRHMGIQLGSQSGGYRQLMHGMSAAAAAAAAAAPAAVAAVPVAGSMANAPATFSQGCETDSMEDEPARSEDQARASAEAHAGEPEPSVQLVSHTGKSARQEAEEALAKLAAVGQTWSDDNDTNWKWLSLATKKALEDVDSMLCNTRVSGLEKRATPVPPFSPMRTPLLTSP